MPPLGPTLGMLRRLNHHINLVPEVVPHVIINDLEKCRLLLLLAWLLLLLTVAWLLLWRLQPLLLPCAGVRT